MKTNSYRFTQMTITRCHGLAARVGLLLAVLAGLFAVPTRAADRQALHYDVPGAATNSESVRHMSRWKRLNLSIGLPLRDREGLTNLLAQIYDPSSPNFRHYLSPEQFTERFGPTKEDYEAVATFARTHGLKITAQHSNRMLLSVDGTVADVERVLHVRMNEFQHPTEDRTFFAPSGTPAMDLDTPVLSVAGLDNFVVPRKCLHPLAATQAKPNATGSGPQGTYLGYDFRAAYVPGVPLLGTGQTVGLLEFDSGFYQSDITAYETLAGLPTNVPVTAVLLDGYDGGPGIGNDEVSLDIEMAISMAPGLSGVLVYEGSTTDDILNRMATDNTAKQIGASWTYGIDATSEQIFLQFAAQGQSFFNASGDSDAYTGVVPTPSDDPNVIVVGGTTLTTTGPDGAWVSETVWNWGGGTGSSGGVSTVYSIPPWQQGISMAANGGSTTMRNLPDVALTADNVYVAYNHGQSGGFGGTSCATPLWAAFTALMNQLAVTNKEPLVGFLNPTVYAIGKGSNALPYTTLFHDTTTGNNESPTSPSKFVAVPGYDLCTGWGTPVGSNLISAIAIPEPLRISPLSGLLFSGPVGGPFGPAQNFSLTNSGGKALNWSLTNTSSLFNVSSTSGSLTPGGGAADGGGQRDFVRDESNSGNLFLLTSIHEPDRRLRANSPNHTGGGDAASHHGSTDEPGAAGRNDSDVRRGDGIERVDVLPVAAEWGELARRRERFWVGHEHTDHHQYFHNQCWHLYRRAEQCGGCAGEFERGAHDRAVGPGHCAAALEARTCCRARRRLSASPRWEIRLTRIGGRSMDRRSSTARYLPEWRAIC